MPSTARTSVRTNSMRRTALFAICSALAAWGLLLVENRWGQSSRAETASFTPEPRPAVRTHAPVRAASVARPQAASAQAAIDTPAPERPRERTDRPDRATFMALPREEQAKLERARFAEYFQKLDGIRESQDRDLQWQSEVSDRVTAVMKKGTPKLVGSSIESIDCGSTLCRVVAKHASDPVTQMDFQSGFLRELMFTASLQNLGDKSVVYLARFDEALPQFD